MTIFKKFTIHKQLLRQAYLIIILEILTFSLLDLKQCGTCVRKAIIRHLEHVSSVFSDLSIVKTIRYAPS